MATIGVDFFVAAMAAGAGEDGSRPWVSIFAGSAAAGAAAVLPGDVFVDCVIAAGGVVSFCTSAAAGDSFGAALAIWVLAGSFFGQSNLLVPPVVAGFVSTNAPGSGFRTGGTGGCVVVTVGFSRGGALVDCAMAGAFTDAERLTGSSVTI